MKLLRGFLFIFSFIILLHGYSQPLRVNRIRIGIDPIRSLSMFFKEKDFYNNKFFYNTWEVNAEIIGPYRTSIVSEFGFTRAHIQQLNATLDYYSSGYYAKLGLDFNLTEDHSKYEFDIGWRIAYAIYQDHSFINLEGKYWETSMQKAYPEVKAHINWGEFIFNQKIRMFYSNHTLNDFYVGMAIRLKFMNGAPSMENFRNISIPGYGPGSSFMPAVTFSLFYQFNIKRAKIKQLMHKHDNTYITR